MTFALEGAYRIDKKHAVITALKDWVDQQYARERVTAIGDDELEQALKKLTLNFMII